LGNATHKLLQGEAEQPDRKRDGKTANRVGVIYKGIPETCNMHPSNERKVITETSATLDNFPRKFTFELTFCFLS